MSCELNVHESTLGQRFDRVTLTFPGSPQLPGPPQTPPCCQPAHPPSSVLRFLSWQGGDTADLSQFPTHWDTQRVFSGTCRGRRSWGPLLQGRVMGHCNEAGTHKLFSQKGRKSQVGFCLRRLGDGAQVEESGVWSLHDKLRNVTSGATVHWTRGRDTPAPIDL